jgi:hypothetical protein
MKTLFFLCALLGVGFSLIAQVPSGISFQGVVRNSSNEIIENQPIIIRFTIKKGSTTGPVEFSEYHLTTTNISGLFSLVIGTGTVTSGNLNSINWASNDYHLIREIDIDSDGNYDISGSSEIWTVPYAFYSAASDSTRIADSVVSKQHLFLRNDTIFLTDGGFVKLPPGFIDTDQQNLSISKTGNNTTISIERGNSISLIDEVNDSDADSSNELQTISVRKDSIFLTDGGFLKLPGDTVPKNSFDGQILYRYNNKWDTLERGIPGQILITNSDGLPKWSGNTYPIVNTISVSSITATSASINVNISSDGGQSISTRGVVINTSENPTIGNSSQVNGNGTGSFTVTITGLSPNTTYYVRGYGTNQVGTGYGNSLTFKTTMPTLPVIVTNTISGITQTSAYSGGVITSDGGSSIISRGVVWNTSSNPTLDNGFTEDGAGSGNYYSNMTGLSDNTVYYVRAYATNSIGTAYGNELIFTTASL